MSHSLRLVTENSDQEPVSAETRDKIKRNLQDIAFEETGLPAVDERTAAEDILEHTLLEANDLPLDNLSTLHELFRDYVKKHPEDEKAKEMLIEYTDAVIKHLRGLLKTRKVK